MTKKQSTIGTKVAIKQCVYGSVWGTGFWAENPNNTVSFIWYGQAGADGEYVSKTLPNLNTSYVERGYTYSRGDYNYTSRERVRYYLICRY